jgi:uncharacterized membrane protein YbhN (UPF0104 family)
VARPLGALAVLAVVVWELGTGPFIDGVRTVDARALGAGVLLGAVTTGCAAYRWQLVARGLGVHLSLPDAVAAYYRSIFLNLVLPGGVVGDVPRGVRHGRADGDLGRGLRAVAWERTAGQVVQAVVTVAVLLAFPSPVRRFVPVVAVVTAAAVLVLAVLAWRLPATGGERRWARAVHAVRSDVRDGLLARRSWPGIVLASATVVAGHATTFVIAARTAGTPASVATLLPLSVLVLLAMVLPSLGGWGPREGASAWAFGAAGLGAAQGVSTAVVFGVMVLVSALPGAGVLVLARVRRRHAEAQPVDAPLSRVPAAAGPDGSSRG